MVSCCCFFATLVLSINAETIFKIDINSARKPVWTFYESCTTADVASLALRQDWQQQLLQTKQDIGINYVRFHGIFNDDVGIVNGYNDYSYVNVDIIYDYILSIGMKPFIELDFMPQLFALIQTPDPSYHSTVYGSPPSNYTIWTEFIIDFVSHLIDRYGINEVLSWPGFEAWNEPNFGENFVVPNVSNTSSNYNQLQLQEFAKYYNYTGHAIKSVNKNLKFGGPASAAGKWIKSFSDITKNNNFPMDFFSTHIYPRDPPCVQNKTGYIMQLKNISNIINGIFGEMDIYLSAYGLYTDQGTKNYYNAPHDTSINAAGVITLVYQFHKYLDPNTWKLMSLTGFSDVWEKPGWFSQPFHDGLGWINMNDIKKPTYWALKLLHDYASNRLYYIDYSKTSNNDNLDLFVTINEMYNEIAFFIANWNWPLNVTINNETVDILVTVNNTNSIPKYGTLYRIDSENCNPEQVWYNMGYPTYPTKQQMNTIRSASKLSPQNISVSNTTTNTFTFNLDIPSYGLAVLIVTI